MSIESSSFVVLKKYLSKKQKEMIIDYVYWIDIFKNYEDDIEKFKNYESKSWNITEYNDLIFGETSNFIFNMSDYLKYISIDNKYIMFDDGCTSPSEKQLDFIKEIKEVNQVIKITEEIEKSENIKKDFKPSSSGLDFSRSKPSISGINFDRSKPKRHEKKKK